MSDELEARFRVALAALVEKHGLDLSERTTWDSRWLAWWLWGDYQKEYRFRPEWLAPPSQAWRLRSRIAAFEHLYSLPTSLVQSLIESWKSEQYGG
jgi:hypothetical protein